MFDWVLYTPLKRLKFSRWPNNRNLYNVPRFMFSLFLGYFFYLFLGMFFIALLGCSFFDFWSSSPLEYPVHHYIRCSAILAIINFVTFFVKVIFSFIFFLFFYSCWPIVFSLIFFEEVVYLHMFIQSNLLHFSFIWFFP